MLTEYLPALLLSWSIQLTGALSPGPSVALIVGTAISGGRAPALRCAAGVATGSAVLASLTALGVTALIASFGNALQALRILGGLYLVWLAIKAFRKAIRPSGIPEPDVRETRPALSGFLLQVSNPKAIAFWIAIASVGGIGDVPLMVKALFVIGAFAVSFVAHGAWGLALSAPRIRQAYGKARRWIEGILGIFFLFAGWQLMTSRA